MSILNPGYPTRCPKSSAHFGAESGDDAASLVILPLLVLAGGLIVYSVATSTPASRKSALKAEMSRPVALFGIW